MHTVGLRADGTVVAVGDNDFGQLDVSSWKNITQVSAGYMHTVGLKADGTVVAAGDNQYGQCNVSAWTNIVQVAGGAYHTVGLRGDGTVVAVGRSDVVDPLNAAAWTNVVRIAAGVLHTAGLKPDGTVVAAGLDIWGQMNVSDWTNIVQVMAGYTHTIGLKPNGTAVGVGADYWGQLNVGAWTNIVQVALLCYEHSVGLKADGTVVAVGDNTSGQLNVGAWTNIVQVAVGEQHSVGLKADGTVVAVGDNSRGQLNVSEWNLKLFPPFACAGPNQTVHVGRTVRLNGWGSFDPSGALPLAYNWSFVSVPVGSTAVLSDATALRPTFVPDVTGNYVVQLIVTNNAGLKSTPDNVSISTRNTPPVANPGHDQAIIQVGRTVQLDGSHSYDLDGDPITYAWMLVSTPPGSAAVLTGANTAMPSFVADVHGTYITQLIVSDPWVSSPPKSVSACFLNVKPLADAGAGQVGVVGDMVNLDGSRSFDANRDPLTYQWSFSHVPWSSNAVIINPASARAGFVPDQPGVYVVQLIVNDGFANSNPDTVQVMVATVLDNALSLVKDMVKTVGALDTSVFKNRMMRNALIGMLHDVMTDIGQGRQVDALQDLQVDITGRVDGCARSGVPDGDDWIASCPAQAAVYQKLAPAIDAVKELMKK